MREHGAAAPLEERDDDCQPAYLCDHCRKPARKAVAVTLRPWSLSDTRASAGWLCGECADELRVWLGDEPGLPPAEGARAMSRITMADEALRALEGEGR